VVQQDATSRLIEQLDEIADKLTPRFPAVAGVTR
jgi:hypothetical protein